MKYHVKIHGRDHEVVLDERAGALLVTVDGQRIDLSYQEIDDSGQVLVTRDGKSVGLSISGDASHAAVSIAGHLYDVQLEDERERAARAAERASSREGGVVTSVMPGVVVEILVRPRESVTKGQPLLILSAMKMQNEIAAPSDGVVADIHVSAGQAVSTGAKLVTLSSA
ncbi:MAG: biotin/lipoyl-containing protein [Planctomycetota bacterium]